MLLPGAWGVPLRGAAAQGGFQQQNPPLQPPVPVPQSPGPARG